MGNGLTPNDAVNNRDEEKASVGIVRVLIVDDHPTVVQCVRDFVGGFEGMEIAGEVSNGHDAIDVSSSADVMILDLEVPGKDGFEVLKALRERASQVKVLVFSSYEDDANVVEVLRLGAVGFVSKEARPEELVQAVRTVGRGERYVDWRVSGAFASLVEERDNETITPKERQLLSGLARGLRNHEIASEMNYQLSTISSYLSNTYSKLGVDNRTAAVREARRRGLILNK